MLDVVQKYQRAFKWMKVEDVGLRYSFLEQVGGRGLDAPANVDWANISTLFNF